MDHFSKTLFLREQCILSLPCCLPIYHDHCERSLIFEESKFSRGLNLLKVSVVVAYEIRDEKNQLWSPRLLSPLSSNLEYPRLLFLK
jgi:hypothetical protein